MVTIILIIILIALPKILRLRLLSRILKFIRSDLRLKRLANKLEISREKLIRFIPDARLSYIPKADELLSQIFLNAPGYGFLFKTNESAVVSSLCGLVNLLPRNIVNKINKVKIDLVNAGIFNKLNTIQIAACIYYVVNKLTIGKRLEIVLPETGKTTKITIELLSSKCGAFSAGTLAKSVAIITNFYDNNQDLKAQIS